MTKKQIATTVIASAVGLTLVTAVAATYLFSKAFDEMFEELDFS